MSKRTSLFFSLLPVLALLACSEPVDKPECNLNSDCVAGYLCDPEGECQKLDRVSIRAATLPDALVGDPEYSYVVQADNGITPYRWSLKILSGQEELSWLTIGEQSGELHPEDGQEPAVPGQDLQVEVTVTDSSNRGAGESASRVFELSVTNCRGPQTTTATAAGKTAARPWPTRPTAPAAATSATTRRPTPTPRTRPATSMARRTPVNTPASPAGPTAKGTDPAAGRSWAPRKTARPAESPADPQAARCASPARRARSSAAVSTPTTASPTTGCAAPAAPASSTAKTTAATAATNATCWKAGSIAWTIWRRGGSASVN